jgi:hypothetical protein
MYSPSRCLALTCEDTNTQHGERKWGVRYTILGGGGKENRHDTDLIENYPPSNIVAIHLETTRHTDFPLIRHRPRKETRKTFLLLICIYFHGNAFIEPLPSDDWRENYTYMHTDSEVIS